MGQTYLGHLVGVGRKNNFYVSPVHFLYSIHLSWRVFQNKESVNKITSAISILGLINLPIIKFSVEWWTTLHQPASITLSGSSIHSSMLLPLFIMTAAFVLFSVLIFLMKYNTELIKIKNKGLDRI